MTVNIKNEALERWKTKWLAIVIASEDKGLDPAINSRTARKVVEMVDLLRDRVQSLEREIENAIITLAHTDVSSLPNDWTLQQVCEARIDHLSKLRDQVRDTCKRAENAEKVLAQIYHDWDGEPEDMVPVLEVLKGKRIRDFEDDREST